MSYYSIMFGGTIPLNQRSKVFTSWTQAHNTGTSNAAAGVTNQNIFSVGYQYDLSTRTDWYAATSYATNAGFVNGVNSYILVSGIRHRF
jgi:predicted porin